MQEQKGEKILEIGHHQDGTPVEIPVEIMRKHFVCFGASGSGKTVLGKVFLEEMARNGVPCIIVDPQGDLASLGIPADQTRLVAHAADLKKAKAVVEDTEVRLFSPASSKGIPLRVDLFSTIDEDLSMEEQINAIDMTASTIVQLLDHDLDSPKGKGARKMVYHLLKAVHDRGRGITDIHDLIDLIQDPSQVDIIPSRLGTEREREKMMADLGNLTIGTDDLLFSYGVGMNMETFLTPLGPGRVPVNVVYLNTLNTERHKHFFLASLCKEIYKWMLKNPSRGVQLALYIDEVAPFMPPYPRNPPAKRFLKMLFKQGRKYGVSMMACTQNVGDIDYKAVSQASTWALGRLMTKQDIRKVSHLIKALPQEDYERVLAALPKLEARNFALVSTDLFEGARMFTSRWLYTKHRTLDETSLKGAMRPEVLDHFKDPLRMAPGDELRTAPPPPLEPEGTVPGPSVARSPQKGEPRGDGVSRSELPHDEGPAPPPDGPWPSAEEDELPESPAGDEGTKAVPLEKVESQKEEEPLPPEKRFVYVADVKVSQADASKNLMNWKNDLLFDQEEITDVETEYLLLWRMMVQVEVKEGLIPFLAKKITTEQNLYFEGSRNLPTSGQLMQVGDMVRFTNVTSKDAHEIVDLDGHTEFSVLDRKELPFDVERIPQLNRQEVERILYNLYGVRAIKARRVIYRLWRFDIRDRKTGRQRFLRIDSVFGKPVQIL